MVVVVQVSRQDLASCVYIAVENNIKNNRYNHTNFKNFNVNFFCTISRGNCLPIVMELSTPILGGIRSNIGNF